jgi:D-glycero-D-manno-heptose 1,7-bisphosphate phosphatase
MSERKAVFLDKDGTLHDNKEGYLYKPEDIDFLPGVLDGLKKLQDAGFRLVIVTQQSGIGRGYYTRADFQKLMDWMSDQFGQSDVEIEGVYLCPHHPNDNCECRKPRTGMFLQAGKELNIPLDSESWSVGDGERDVIAGKRVGLSTILISNSKSEKSCEEADYQVKSFPEAVKTILSTK